MDQNQRIAENQQLEFDGRCAWAQTMGVPWAPRRT